MSDIPTKTYPPECLHAMIADHEAEQAGATSEASSAVETKGDTMSYITRWKVSGPATRLRPDADGPWVALVDYYRVIDRLIAERDAARGEVERLRANGQGMFDSSRPSDEDIWREIFLQCISDYITADRRVIVADTMLAEYRKRWPR